MNGFADKGLDEDAFGEKKGLSSGIRSFDAFRMLTLCFWQCVPELLHYAS